MNDTNYNAPKALARLFYKGCYQNRKIWDFFCLHLSGEPEINEEKRDFAQFLVEILNNTPESNKSDFAWEQKIAWEVSLNYLFDTCKVDSNISPLLYAYQEEILNGVLTTALCTKGKFIEFLNIIVDHIE